MALTASGRRVVRHMECGAISACGCRSYLLDHSGRNRCTGIMAARATIRGHNSVSICTHGPRGKGGQTCGMARFTIGGTCCVVRNMRSCSRRLGQYAWVALTIMTSIASGCRSGANCCVNIAGQPTSKGCRCFVTIAAVICCHGSRSKRDMASPGGK